MKFFLNSITVSVFFFCICNQAFAVNILQFTRSNSLTFEMLEDTRLPNSHVYNDFDMIFTLGESWVQSPLVFKNSSNSSQIDEIIKEMYSTHLGFGAYLTDTFFLGATTAYSTFKTADGKTISDFSDIHLTARWRFLTRKLWAMSIIPQVGIPVKGGEYTVVDPNTSSPIGTSNFLSDDSFGVGAKIAFERLFSWGQIVTNIGYRYSKDAVFITNPTTNDGINMEQQLYTGAGVYIPITKKMGTNIEWARLWSIPFNKNLNPNEFYAGVSTGLTKTLAAFGGLSFGNPFSSNDGNDIRISGGLKYVPRLWSEPRKLFDPVDPAPVPNSVPKIAEVTHNICDSKYIFDSTNIIVLRFENDIGSLSGLNSELKSVIGKLKERLDDIQKIVVVGHTSTPATKAYNLALSQKRASTVESLLISGGIPKSLMSSIGKGESQLLIDPEVTKSDQAKNRRTEFKVYLKPKYDSCF